MLDTFLAGKKLIYVNVKVASATFGSLFTTKDACAFHLASFSPRLAQHVAALNSPTSLFEKYTLKSE